MKYRLRLIEEQDIPILYEHHKEFVHTPGASLSKKDNTKKTEKASINQETTKRRRHENKYSKLC